MSFKREGDDRSQLNVLKKRRVADLLSNYIPEDEAALMKNGRYTCLVCSYRPVFDTVDMLTVHRNGKKHVSALQKFYGKKTELKNEIVKRQHENYVQSEEKPQEASSCAPLLVQTRKLTHHALLKSGPETDLLRTTEVQTRKLTHHALLKSGPYDSRHRKHSFSTKSDNRRSEAPCGPAHGPGRPDGPDRPPVDRLPLSTGWSADGSHGSGPSEGSEPTTQRRRELEHYLKLKSDGWIQDGAGRWVRDEGVEFDSDEEEPPSLSTPPT